VLKVAQAPKNIQGPLKSTLNAVYEFLRSIAEVIANRSIGANALNKDALAAYRKPARGLPEGKGGEGGFAQADEKAGGTDKEARGERGRPISRKLPYFLLPPREE